MTDVIVLQETEWLPNKSLSDMFWVYASPLQSILS